MPHFGEVLGERPKKISGDKIAFAAQQIYTDSDLFFHTKFNHFADKYKKMGDFEKTIRSSVSAATLLKVNNLINTSGANYICKFGDFSNKNIMF